jgi:hypothetical protein
VQLRSWTATARNHPVRAKAAYDATSLLDRAHSNIRPASRGGRRLLNPVLSGLAASTHERPDIGRDTRLSRGGRYGPLRPLPPRPAQPWLSLSAGRLGLCVRGLDVEAIRAQSARSRLDFASLSSTWSYCPARVGWRQPAASIRRGGSGTDLPLLRDHGCVSRGRGRDILRRPRS